MFLTEDAITGAYETCFKVNPPLRTSDDAQAIIEGVLDGSVDAIVTDHAPHADWEKAREFELAPFGMIGIEASLALINTNLVKTGKMGYGKLVELMSINPRKILGVEPVSIEANFLADITVFDADIEWTVGEDGYVSHARRTAVSPAPRCPAPPRRLRGRKADS